MRAEIVDQRSKEGRSGRFDLVRMDAEIEGTATLPLHLRRAAPMRFVREVRPEPMVDFADLLQDPNPIHLDEAAARGRVINQGPINAGYVIAMLREAYPDATISVAAAALHGQRARR